MSDRSATLIRPPAYREPGVGRAPDLGATPPRARSGRPAPRRTPLTDWLLTALLLAGVGVTLAGFHPVLGGVEWWFQAMLVAAVVLVAGAAVRSIARHPLWGSLAAAVVAVATIVAMFAPGTAILLFIPTGDTYPALHDLEVQGMVSIAEQDVPAVATPGILFLLCVGIAAVAVALDLVALGLRQAALAGIPLAVLLLVPSFVRSHFSDAGIFILAAAVYIAILLVRRSRRMGLRGAVGLGATAIVVALLTPITMPSQATQGGGGGSNLTAGVNPIITLGDDLRRGDPKHAITYVTTADKGQYLRLAVLEDFSGRSWSPNNIEVMPGNDVAEIAPPPGFSAAVPYTPITTTITIDQMLSRWLPVPYAPVSVRGLEGTWTWEPDGLAIRTENSNVRGQDYEVDSILVQPSIEQLVAAGITVEPGFERLLELPADLPAIVATTAAEVTREATNNYDRAIALQEFFTGGLFAYSEETPVEDGYDGSGAAVLGEFLEARSGYCVHFSSAMAAMARTLGIPARVAVGFTPGVASQIEGTPLYEYNVDTFDLHAWPELYFSGIGWIRFEPTPGRGYPPAFAQLVEDDPATPDIDESVPEAEQTQAPTTENTAAPNLPDEVDPGAIPEGEQTAAVNPWTWLGPAFGVAGALLLLAPAIIRAVRRARRLQAVDDGSAADGWSELRDTAADLGWRTADTLTPRQLGDDLGDLLGADGARLVDRLRSGFEHEAFAARDGGITSDDVTRALRMLRRQAGFTRRIVARFAPVSLVERWLPANPEVVSPAAARVVSPAGPSRAGSGWAG